MMEDQAVIVTGGSSGIGLAIAKLFAQHGARVVIGSRRKDAVDSARSQIRGKHLALGDAVDVADRGSASKFIQDAIAALGRLDILVLAAGINIRNRSMAEMSPQEWDQVMGINATGAYNCLHAALPTMKSQRRGLIFNISSVAGKRALPLGGVAYAASKFAMTALGMTVANEVAADGIRVVNVYPGEVNTPILDHRPVAVTEEHRQRILQPDDVASLLYALALLPPHVHVPEVVIKPISQGWY